MSKIAEAAYGDKPFEYPNRPGFKARGTSRDAAFIVAPRAREIREQVYEIIKGAGPIGLTADEVAEKLDRKPGYIRPRLSELRAAERIIPTGERRRNASNLSAQVWRAV